MFATGQALAERVDEPARLAPGPDDLVTSLERVETLLGEAETIGRATDRLQNAFGKDRAAVPRVKCSQTATLSYAARAQIFGQAHRDRVQVASAEQDRLDRLAIAPTVAPALDEALLERVAESRKRVDAEIRHVRVNAAWHERYMLPRLKECRPALVPVAGIPTWHPTETLEDRSVAVIGMRDGVVCPAGEPAQGQVIILTEHEACWDRDAECYCKPEPVWDGAVLGEAE